MAKHATASDCWTIFQGKVYDVTLYMDFHAGGKKELLRGAGKDMTAMLPAALRKCSSAPPVLYQVSLARFCGSSLVVVRRRRGAGVQEGGTC